MDYVQITAKQREEMLKAVGARTMDDLLKQVPDAIRLHRPLDVAPALDELTLRKHLADLASRNTPADGKVCFLGAGAYDHFILVSQGVHPHYRQVLKTYLSDLPAIYREIPLKNGIIDTVELEDELDQDTAAVICQSPNFLGHIERVETIGKFTHANQSLMIQAFNPLSLGLLKKPGEMDVDIAVADGQPLGIPLQFGGPYLGLFAAKQQYVRKMPGRLVGQT